MKGNKARNNGGLWATEEAVAAIGPAAIPALRPLLKAPVAPVRYNAAKTLGKMGPNAKEAIPDLLPLLKDDATRVRADTASALGRIGPAAREAVPCLMPLHDRVHYLAWKTPDWGVIGR